MQNPSINWVGNWLSIAMHMNTVSQDEFSITYSSTFPGVCLKATEIFSHTLCKETTQIALHLNIHKRVMVGCLCNRRLYIMSDVKWHLSVVAHWIYL